GEHGQLPLLPRGRRHRPQARPPHGQHLQLPRHPAHLGARGLPGEVLSIARPPPPAEATSHRPRRERAGRRGPRPRRPRADHQSPQALGIRRRGPRQLPAQHERGHPAGRRPREPAPVRARGHARVRERQARQRSRLMPLFGQLEAEPLAARLPLMTNLDTEAWPLPHAEILQLAFEVNDETRSLLPRAMHPSVPPYATWLVHSYSESPVGPFSLAQLRLMGRAGAHPRGYVLGAVASTSDAAAALRERWGFPAEVGAVTVRRYHDQVAAVVTVAGEVILEAAL